MHYSFFSRTRLVRVLALIGLGALAGYAYLADLSPAQAEVKLPVTLHAD